MRNTLRGKKALVTGGAHRVGRAVALGLAEAGCDLMIHFHRSAEEAEKTVWDARRTGVAAASAGADLSTSGGVDLLFEHVDRRFDQLDILVNSAATLDAIQLDQIGPEDWERVIGLNLRAAFFCLQAAARRMPAGSCVVNISDTAGERPWARFPLHSISKAGLEMMTKVAALSLAPEVRVNALMPGPVMKPQGMKASRWDEILASVPLARSATEKEIAHGVIFLAKHAYITGETLKLEGGSLLI